MQERQSRSTPEALIFTPGVYVQQTAHGQGSPYIRGRTGRHTLLLFDGLRLNHALFRQGPNQYLFTVDAQTLGRLEVLRGSASVELGANALAGAILLYPREPAIDPQRKGFHFQPRLNLRHASADRSLGGRLEVEAQLSPQTGLLTGFGGRRLGQLEAAGPIEGLKEDPMPLEREVPRFEENGRSQMGTGFEELTADARLLHQLSERERLVLAGYLYRQYDAPRTDQCPPPETPDDWCLIYEEQFRSQVLARAELEFKNPLLAHLEAAGGFQRQHERRVNNRIDFINSGEDSIDIWELRLEAQIRTLPLWGELQLRLPYGLDGTLESVSSRGWDTLVRSEISRDRSRGQYIDGSAARQGALWFSPRLDWGRFTLRLGARWLYAEVQAQMDLDSDSPEIDSSWVDGVANAGLEGRFGPLSLIFNLEEGYRSPNLDDMTARQFTGQGLQLGNEDLQPERALSAELGLKLNFRALHLELWAFRSRFYGLMERKDSECPPSDRSCSAMRRAPPVTLVNLSDGLIYGYEAALSLRIPHGVQLKSSLSWAWGEGDSPLDHEQGEQRPLSRIPPLNGNLELLWRQAHSGLYAAAALRWAAAQERLSFGDSIDRRIPFGGTPGYSVLDLRAGLRLPQALSLNLVVENLTDEAYRIHGSSVNGAGRGFILNLEIEP